MKNEYTRDRLLSDGCFSAARANICVNRGCEKSEENRRTKVQTRKNNAALFQVAFVLFLQAHLTCLKLSTETNKMCSFVYTFR